MNDYPLQVLKELIGQQGVSLCDDPRRCESFLRDLCGTYKREINVLVQALNERVAAELLTAGEGVPDELLIRRLSQRLQDNLALTPDASLWTVRGWARVLDGRTSRTFAAGVSDERTRLATLAELTGDRAGLSDAFELSPGLVHFQSSHTGPDAFYVELRDAEGEYVATLANHVGASELSKLVRIGGGRHVLSVDADGAWRVTARRPEPVDGAGRRKTIKGSGSQGSPAVSLERGKVEFYFSHGGEANFVVNLVRCETDEAQLLMNHVGSCDVRKRVQVATPGDYALDVMADGEWTITVG